MGDMRRDAERTGPRNGPSTRTGPALPLVKRPFAADAFGLWIVVCAHFPVSERRCAVMHIVIVVSHGR